MVAESESAKGGTTRKCGVGASIERMFRIWFASCEEADPTTTDGVEIHTRAEDSQHYAAAGDIGVRVGAGCDNCSMAFSGNYHWRACATATH